MEWKPIETAPKDGTEILAWGYLAGEVGGIDDDPRMAIIWIVEGHSSTDYDGYDWNVIGSDFYAVWFKPTHWMHLPNPPNDPQ